MRSKARRQRAAMTHPGWLLLWAPALLVAVDDSSGLTASMVRLGVVLVLATLIWGSGRGPASPRAERAFAGLLLIAWFTACGTAFREQGVPASIAARLAVTGALLLGPALLLWAWRRRSMMTPVVDEIRGGAPPEARAFLAKLVAALSVALLLVYRWPGLRTADLVVVACGFALYAVCRVRGRRTPVGAAG